MTTALTPMPMKMTVSAIFFREGMIRGAYFIACPLSIAPPPENANRGRHGRA